jgi:hypothetical protein
MPALPILRRDDDDDIVCNYWGCYSYTSYVIKWIVFAAIIGACLLFFVIGFIHAKQRMKKGLLPLAYHRVRSSPSPLPGHHTNTRNSG